MESPPFVAISGKMFSGKDTLADGIVDLLRARGLDVVRKTYSDFICAEAQQGVLVMRALSRRGREVVVGAVAEAVDLDIEAAQQFVDAIDADLGDPDFTIRSRTKGSRFILQQLGRDWRPEGYWPRKVMALCHEWRADGSAVVLVGIKYLGETQGSRDAGATLVRLDISRAEQVRRSLARDGFAPSDEALDHPGESLLDDYDYDLRVSTDGKAPGEVLDEVAGFLGLS